MNNNHSTTVRRGDEATTKPSSPLKSRRSMQTAKHFPRHFVQHDYKDHADEVDTTGGMIPVKRKRGGVLVPFPIKLYDALERIEEEGNAHVIGWQPHGRCFIIRDPKVFVNELMPRFFTQTKLTSFQRQLNLYGFVRLTQGPDANSYYHELFLKGKRFLIHRMTRTRTKGTMVKGASNPEAEPNFYAMTPVHEVVPRSTMEPETPPSFEGGNEGALTQNVPPQKREEKKVAGSDNLNLGLVVDHIDWSTVSAPVVTPSSEFMAPQCGMPTDTVLQEPSRDSSCAGNLYATVTDSSTLVNGSLVSVDSSPSAHFCSDVLQTTASLESERLLLSPGSNSGHSHDLDMGTLCDNWWQATGVHLLDDFVHDWLPQQSSSAVAPNIEVDKPLEFDDDNLGSLLDRMLTSGDSAHSTEVAQL